MPKYKFALTNGKSLTLEGDTQPSDAEVEEIAKGQGVQLALADAKAPEFEAKPSPIRGWQAPGTFTTTDAEEQPGIVSRTAQMLSSAANPQSVGDMLGLAIPATGGMGAIRMGIPKVAELAEKVGPKLAEAGEALKKHSPLGFVADLVTRHNPLEAMGIAAIPYGAEMAGRTLQRVGAAVKNFKPWEIDLNPKVPQAKALIGQGAHQMPSGVVTPDQIINPQPMSKMPTGTIIDGEIVQDVRGALPARRSVQLPAEMPAPTTVAGADPSFVRAERGTFAVPEAPSGPPTLRQEVKRLVDEGLGAEDIADRLKAHPDLAKAASKKERVNLVREARGGQSGQVPAAARKAIDEAIAGLTTIEQKRAYLMRAPNGAVYEYVKGKLGL